MEYQPYSKPPGPTALPGRSIAKTLPPKPSTSKVGGVFVLVPPLTVPQPSDPTLCNIVSSNLKVPLFAPSETPEVATTSPPAGPVSDPAPKFIPDPKSPLTILYTQQLFQAYTIASMRATQLDIVRRKLQENNVVLSPLANFCLNEVIKSSRLSVVQSAFTMGSRISDRLRRALAGGEIPSEQELIDAMDEEGADESW
ncbi:hypothetical protein H0H93_007621 [Arthromyces matolae]|nr:hypothetical protein H0H93_007621 [Arthromyces matolae]